MMAMQVNSTEQVAFLQPNVDGYIVLSATSSPAGKSCTYSDVSTPDKERPSRRLHRNVSEESDTSTACSTTPCSEADDIFTVTVSQGIQDDGQPCWTKMRVLQLATELLEGYSDPRFQEQLKVLLASAPHEKAAPGRAELAMTVQSKVLPKYGFQPTAEGVDAMTKMFASYMMDWMVEKLVLDIEKKLGLPQGATLEAACGPNNEPAFGIDLDEEPRMMVAPVLRSESMSKASTAKPAAHKEASSSLTKVQVLMLLGELLEAYSSPDFQRELQPLLNENPLAQDLNVPGRKELVLGVQSKVFPKHGLPVGTFGAMLMLDCFTPFIDDFLVKKLIGDVDEKLGLPKDTTVSMCRGSFEKEEPREEPCEVVELTRAQVLALASELLEGFRASAFQEELKRVLRDSGDAQDSPLRAELALTVQRKVLPTYGIAGTSGGVVKMLEQFAPFAFEGDWLVTRMLSDIDESLALPRETTLKRLFSMSAKV